MSAYQYFVGRFMLVLGFALGGLTGFFATTAAWPLSILSGVSAVVLWAGFLQAERRAMAEQNEDSAEEFHKGWIAGKQDDSPEPYR